MLSIIKYAFYGPPNIGILYKYINNNVDKIVIPIKSLIVCLSNKQKPIYNLVYINISNEDCAEVCTSTNTPTEDTEVRCFNTIDKARYIMLYGI